MFRSLMAIIKELYLYLTKVIFMLKTLGKITPLYKLGAVAARLHSHSHYNLIVQATHLFLPSHFSSHLHLVQLY